MDKTTAPPADRVIPWQYDTNAYNPQAFCWTLETSSNLVDWVPVPSSCLTGDIRVMATNPASYFRIIGTIILPTGGSNL